MRQSEPPLPGARALADRPVRPRSRAPLTGATERASPARSTQHFGRAHCARAGGGCAPLLHEGFHKLGLCGGVPAELVLDVLQGAEGGLTRAVAQPQHASQEPRQAWLKSECTWSRRACARVDRARARVGLARGRRGRLSPRLPQTASFPATRGDPCATVATTSEAAAAHLIWGGSASPLREDAARGFLLSRRREAVAGSCRARTTATMHGLTHFKIWR